MGEGEDLGENRVGNSRQAGPKGIGGGKRGGGVTLNVEGVIEAVHEGDGMPGQDGFRAAGEGVGVFPRGENAEGDGGFCAKDGGGGDAAAETSDK